ncbi:O-antigen ligase [Polaromonas sp. A23]|uniref:O-antigen ligase family protein n=1 Tax=Polaromonas sp. A23 TaxID=1944133 RepID=UPI000986E9A7|nr:O-antigen ligase family protein [Polaromonas sp. A23]OOG47603.1 polymerase [Polaromonas sp. A23]
MEQVIIISVLLTGAVLAAFGASLGMAGAVHLTSHRNHGYLHWAFYAILFMQALSLLLSGRDLTVPLSVSELDVPIHHPLQTLAQPLVSLILLTIACERILTHWLKRDKAAFLPSAILVGFVVFWLGTVAAPALLGAHPKMSHAYVYPLVIGMAAVLTEGDELEHAFRAARNALLLFMVAGLLLIPFKTNMVLETSYTQGLLPGVPRLAGLATHAVSLGMLAQICMLCLLAQPFRRTWLNRLAWAVGLGVLFMAQSKTAWISFFLCSACIIAVRNGPVFWRRVGDPVRPEFGIASILGFMAAVTALVLVLMLGDVGGKLSSFFDSAEGAQLASLTGRDRIWAVAWDEWERNPVFGYGPSMWDASFRASIGMPAATHAHNQFMDTLSRAGVVGASALVLYALVLLVLSIRYARVSKGISLALFLALTMRAISEVPLLLFGYGSELVTHMLLLMTLAASASAVRLARPRTVAGRPATATFAAGIPKAT